jgi:hypothetical protein
MHEDSLVDAIGYLNCLHMADAKENLQDAPNLWGITGIDL